MLKLVLLALLLLLVVGALPSWSYSRDWGFFPSGTLGVVLVVVIVLAATGRI